MILTKETLSAGPKIGTGEGVAHSKRWYVAAQFENLGELVKNTIFVA